MLPREGLDAAELRVVENVERHGTHVVQISEQHDSDALYSFTIGMQYTFGHPELAVFGQKPLWQVHFLNALREEVRDGARFTAGSTCSTVLPGFAVVFRDVPEEHYAGEFGWALWFYRRVAPACAPLSVLQVVWPDLHGRLPCEVGYSNPYPQPILDGTPRGPATTFPFGLDQTVVVCSRVAHGAPVLFVNGGETPQHWEFSCGAQHDEDALAVSGETAEMLHLSHLLEADPNLETVSDLRPGECAERDAPGAAWRRWSD